MFLLGGFYRDLSFLYLFFIPLLSSFIQSCPLQTKQWLIHSPVLGVWISSHTCQNRCFHASVTVKGNSALLATLILMKFGFFFSALTLSHLRPFTHLEIWYSLYGRIIGYAPVVGIFASKADFLSSQYVSMWCFYSGWENLFSGSSSSKQLP